LQKKLEKDLWRLRYNLGIGVRFDRRAGTYRLEDAGPNGLLCLPDDCLDTLAFLYNTFQPDAPEAERVRSLLDTVISYLPEEQLRAVQRRRTILNLELRELDERDIHPKLCRRRCGNDACCSSIIFPLAMIRLCPGIIRWNRTISSSARDTTIWTAIVAVGKGRWGRRRMLGTSPIGWPTCCLIASGYCRAGSRPALGRLGVIGCATNWRLASLAAISAVTSRT